MKSCSDHVMGVPLQGCPESECRLTYVRIQWAPWTNCALCPLLAVSCGDARLGLFTLTVSSPRMDCNSVQSGPSWVVESFQVVIVIPHLLRSTVCDCYIHKDSSVNNSLKYIRLLQNYFRKVELLFYWQLRHDIQFHFPSRLWLKKLAYFNVKRRLKCI
jgi:hypothetical protein